MSRGAALFKYNAALPNGGAIVWCRGPTAVSCKQTGAGGAISVEVSCGGVPVKPGDAIIADDRGNVVIDPGEAEAAADLAPLMQQAERTRTIPRIRAGEKCADAAGARAAFEAHKSH